jgi:hypothetical protein
MVLVRAGALGMHSFSLSVMPRTTTPERFAAWALLGIAASEGTWVAVNWLANGRRFVRYLGFGPDAAPAKPLGWLIAAGLTVGFITLAARLPSVRANLVRPSGLKVLGLLVAVSAGILEEVMFRRWVMDFGQRHEWGLPLQILASGVVFGLVHGIWGLFGKSWRAARGAALTTGMLGAVLGVVYVTGGRSLAPCVLAHFFINAFIEPGLMLAASRGEMGGQRNPLMNEPPKA